MSDACGTALDRSGGSETSPNAPPVGPGRRAPQAAAQDRESPQDTVQIFSMMTWQMLSMLKRQILSMMTWQILTMASIAVLWLLMT